MGAEILEKVLPRSSQRHLIDEKSPVFKKCDSDRKIRGILKSEIFKTKIQKIFEEKPKKEITQNTSLSIVPPKTL